MGAKKKGFLETTLQYGIMPYVFGIGGAVVILGALFKLMHWPGASQMLILGLGTEAFIFFIGAFIPVHPDPEWEKVYPQLADESYEAEYDYEEEVEGDSAVSKLDNVLSNSALDDSAIERLGEGLNSLSVSVEKMAEIGDAAAASSEYANNVKAASASVTKLSDSYAQTASAMESMSSAATDASEYHSQVQTITKNLGSLNALYEMELQDANSHLKAMNKFYSNLSTAMDNISDATADSDEFKKGLNSLTSNITQLNTVYGNMLSAMKS